VSDEPVDTLALHDVRPEHQRTHELLAELLAEVRALRFDRVPARRSSKGLSVDDRSRLLAALPIIAGLLGSAPWVVRELLAVAAEPRGLSLHAALGALNAKQLGKLFLRAHGEPIGSYVVERVCDSGRDGALWRVLGDPKVALSRESR
jgi:hypothetical protein